MAGFSALGSFNTLLSTDRPPCSALKTLELSGEQSACFNQIVQRAPISVIGLVLPRPLQEAVVESIEHVHRPFLYAGATDLRAGNASVALRRFNDFSHLVLIIVL